MSSVLLFKLKCSSLPTVQVSSGEGGRGVNRGNEALLTGKTVFIRTNIYHQYILVIVSVDLIECPKIHLLLEDDSPVIDWIVWW